MDRRILTSAWSATVVLQVPRGALDALAVGVLGDPHQVQVRQPARPVQPLGRAQEQVELAQGVPPDLG